MSVYKLLKQGGVQRVEDNACIPPTMDNLDWVRYQDWLAQGNIPLPVDPVPEVVPQITMEDLIAVLPQSSKDALVTRMNDKKASK